MPTLLGRLMARPAADLEHLAGVWAVRLPGRSHAEDVATLYRAMTDTWALRDILETLSPGGARLLWALARDPDAAPQTIVAAPAAARDELAAAGLLHAPADEPAGGEPAPVLADEMGALCRRLAEERRLGDRTCLPLAMLVAALDTGDLAAAAERWGVAFAPGEPRAGAEVALLDRLADPLALDDLLTGLDRADRHLYDLVANAPRGLPLAEVRRRVAEPPPALRRSIRHLHAGLLLWESWVDRERRLFVPEELRARRRPAAPAPLRPVTAELAAWRHPLALAWDLLAWLRAVLPAAALPPDAVHASGRPAPTLPATYPLWHAPAGVGRPAYIGFLQAAQAALGLTDAAAGERWAAAELVDQQAAIVARWRAGRQPWPAEGGAAAPFGPAGWPAARAAALDALARLEPGAWYPVDALAVRVASARAGAVRRAGPAGRRRPAGIEVHGALVLLQTVLVWLGVLEPGRERERRRAAVRVTPLGAWLLGRGPRPPAPAAALVAEPSLRLLVYEVDSPLLWPLLAFAHPEQLDRVSVFRLSRGGVAAGLAAGLSGAAMVEALARAARHELPQGVVYSLRDWARAARHARLERALLLTFDGEPARDQALGLPALQALGAAALPGARLTLPIDDADAERRARAVLSSLGFGSREPVA